MAPIDRQHLSCHAFIALISPFAVFKKTFAGILHCYFIRRRAIGAGLQLTFEVDAERVRSLLGLEVLALPTTAIIGIVYNPSGLCLSCCDLLVPLANRCRFDSNHRVETQAALEQRRRRDGWFRSSDGSEEEKAMRAALGSYDADTIAANPI